MAPLSGGSAGRGWGGLPMVGVGGSSAVRGGGGLPMVGVGVVGRSDALPYGVRHFSSAKTVQSCVCVCVCVCVYVCVCVHYRMG